MNDTRPGGAVSALVDSMINTDAYPVHEPESDAYRALIEQGRQALDRDGILCLEEFLTAAAVTELRDEIVPLENKGYLQEQSHTVYFSPVDETQPDGHPLRVTVNTRKRSIARHLLSPTGPCNTLFQQPELRRLVADLLGKEVLYLHEDPSNAVVINAYGPKEELGWHFDRAYFTVTILLREADGGGDFEYITNLRSPSDENYQGVQAAIAGTGDTPVQVAPQSEGMMTIFLGNHALHRVKPVSGAATRLVLIYHFEEKPGVRISATHRRMFFGPDAPDD